MVPVGDGHTEVSEDDREQLIPTYISTRGELFEAEESNISEALLRPRPAPMQLLDDKYLRDLHRAMFGDVWRCAGRYRRTDTNIGLPHAEIAASVRLLIDDVVFWVDNATYEPDEIAARFHHRLVFIHPFANGNGRHSRVATDYLLQGLGREPFTWGADLEVETEALRSTYRSALQRADGGDLIELLTFVRT